LGSVILLRRGSSVEKSCPLSRVPAPLSALKSVDFPALV
jgi:hypothetical protein